MNLKTAIALTFKVLAITLVLAVLLPTAVKFNHVFSHHTHKVCKNDNSTDTHFHVSDFDCDFYKFKLSNNLFLVINSYEITTKKLASFQPSSYYISSNNYQQQTRFVRGPPTLS
ncbi:hypothetical protein HNV10_09555 [Winogradskyella litoriviva]|uniref:Transmembrane protein n=1 Tax=Winogradskyella litoriviva TaxID=1220182 RepID=A0ABX2E5B3_9FLAO|nr:hypothetical protein [Winogradskyella litoriviva]NRD23484.1 hypothetical protein [Winogradskyella litoriviva]